jgi:hypothetical protein
MIDMRRRDRFTLEARHNLRQRAHLRMEDFDSDLLAHEHMLGRVNDAHAAFTENALDLVALRDHRSGRNARVPHFLQIGRRNRRRGLEPLLGGRAWCAARNGISNCRGSCGFGGADRHRLGILPASFHIGRPLRPGTAEMTAEKLG